MRSIDLGYIVAILFLVAASGSAQMGYSMQHSIGLSDDIDNATSGDDYLSFSFPWYGSDISFSRPDFNTSFSFNTSHELSSAFSFFSGFYSTTGKPMMSGIVSAPIKFDITGRIPARIYFGSGQELQYSKYISTMASRNNELWIQGSSAGSVDWSQFVVCPVGSWLQLVAYTPAGGSAGFYEIFQNNTETLTYRTYQFFPGYNNMSFPADQAGRHILLFVVNNQPSNAIIVDVFGADFPDTESMPPSGVMTSYGGQTSQLSGSSQYIQQYSPGPATMPVHVPSSMSSDVPVTIKSNGMRGYEVYVDEVYIGKETAGDGSFSFSVKGNMYHDIRVYDGQFNYPKRIYFQSGVSKIINVEPGTAVYA